MRPASLNIRAEIPTDPSLPWVIKGNRGLSDAVFKGIFPLFKCDTQLSKEQGLHKEGQTVLASYRQEPRPSGPSSHFTWSEPSFSSVTYGCSLARS